MTIVARSKPQQRLMTTAEYLTQSADDLDRTELIYGEVVMSPAAPWEHNDLIYFLRHIVGCWTAHFKLGKVAFDIDMVLHAVKNLVYRPDLLFVSAAHAARRRRGRVYGAADLCVEVLSPSDRPWIQNRKFADYERYGVTWYWIICPDPAAPSISEHELVNGKYQSPSEITGNAWFEPCLFPGLIFRLPPMIAGAALKTAVKGKAKKLV